MKNHKKLSENVIENILAMITVDKRFAIGDQLPNELELARELNVSRTTLREAIRVLIAYGVLEVRRGCGTFVTSDAADLRRNLEPLTGIKGNSTDLFEMRLIIEPEAAYWAALRGTDAEIKRIEELQNIIEENQKKHHIHFKDEYLFHQTIAQASHNEYMKEIIPILYQGALKGFNLLFKDRNVIPKNNQYHRLIIEFLKLRNAEGARNAMKLHMLHTIEWYNQK